MRNQLDFPFDVDTVLGANNGVLHLEEEEHDILPLDILGLRGIIGCIGYTDR